jgi:hypothetical protein
MGPPSKEPVEAVVDPRAAPRQSLLEVTYAKLDAKGVGARGVNDLPSRVVLLCENDSRLESAETSGSFWPAVFAAARTEQTGNKTPFAYTGATAVYPDSTLVAIESTGGGILAALRALEKILGRAKTDDGDGAAGEKAPFASARVVASSEDAASAFPGWHAGFVEALALDDGYEPLEEARVLKVATKANVAVVELGMRLGAAARAEDDAAAAEALGEMRALELEDAFPTQQQLMGVLRNVDDGPPTVSEFLDVYDAALDVDLDSENVWPPPPPLRF